jgi:hypothetical protein
MLHRIVYIIYKILKIQKCGTIVPVPYKWLKRTTKPLSFYEEYLRRIVQLIYSIYVSVKCRLT